MAAAVRPLIAWLVAASEDDVIGRDNALPWRLPDDLRRFKRLTLGKPVLMGRKTFESIGKPLAGRTNIVLTHSLDWHVPDVVVVGSIAEAIERAGDAPELIVIGGAQVYAATLALVERIYLTRVHAHVSGDTRLPALDLSTWREVEQEYHAADERHAYAMTFSVLERQG
jgi:dihydrofolate reductase